MREETFIDRTTIRLEHDYVYCDRCRLPFETVHSVVRIIRDMHVRVEGIRERVSSSKLLGAFCDSCADFALRGFQASATHPARVTVGSSNPHLLMHLSQIIKYNVPIGPCHVELESLGDNVIRVEVITINEVLVYVYHIDTQVLIPVPTREKGRDGEEGS